MTHYNLLKLKDPFDTEKVLTQCKAVYAELEAELDFLHDASVTDIMMVMRIDSPEQLGAYLQHPKHVALSQGLQDAVAARMSFDAE